MITFLTATVESGILDAISSFISSIGFPIAAFLIMVKLNKDQSKSHKEEMDNLKDVLSNNTAAIEKVSERLTSIEKIVDKLP